MKKILLVDDDALIVQIYRRKLEQEGFQVEAAGDGLAAMKLLPTARPDVVVLDLMMPKFGGVDVLKYIRSTPALKDTPVIVLSNFYVSDMAEKILALGVEKAVLKSECTPTLLCETIRALPPAAVAPAPAAAPTAPPADGQAALRRDFLKSGSATLGSIRELCHTFIRETAPEPQARALYEFCHKIHFLTAMAALAGCEQLALFSSVFEGLLFELQEKPQFINASSLQTVVNAADFLGFLFARGGSPAAAVPLSARALVVDDDPLSTRTTSTALRRAGLSASYVENAKAALDLLRDNHFDLFLLDIAMPEMDGFELCTKLRALPSYKKTPVIFVTSHADFENRAKSILTGGNDLIAKPVFPIELAVKAVTHLLKSQLGETT